jgi:hypothetical protein
VFSSRFEPHFKHNSDDRKAHQRHNESKKDLKYQYCDPFFIVNKYLKHSSLAKCISDFQWIRLSFNVTKTKSI